MIAPRIVLCPLDFSDLGREELNVAVEACEAFGARLVLHHNLSSVGPGLTRAWEWNSVHQGEKLSAAEAEKAVRKIMTGLPKAVAPEAVVSTGPVAGSILELAEKLPADLVVIGSHGWSTPEHASVAERLIDRCPCPVLTIQEGSMPARSLRLRPPSGTHLTPVLVPTDLSAGAARVVEHAFDLARQLPLRLHLLHVVQKGDTGAAERALEDLVPPELTAQTERHVESGDPIEVILEYIRRLDPGFAIVGEHTKGFFRRLFIPDRARAVLHRAQCPVWFVPASA